MCFLKRVEGIELEEGIIRHTPTTLPDYSQINGGLPSHRDAHTSSSLWIKSGRTGLKQMGPNENGVFVQQDQ